MLAAIIGLMMIPTYDSAKLTVPVLPDPIETQKIAWMQELHHCENAEDVPWIWDTNGKKSYADFMYQMATWLKYGKEFGATSENIGSSTLQWKVTRYVLDIYGWQNDWITCGQRTVNKLGEYPH